MKITNDIDTWICKKISQSKKIFIMQTFKWVEVVCVKIKLVILGVEQRLLDI